MMARLALTLLIAAAVLTPAAVSAQNDVLLSQYYEVPSFYNPAATGLGDMVRIRGVSRLQWVGIDNAPKAFIGLADSPFRLGKRRLGAGVAVYQESMGLFDNLVASLQLSVKFRLFGGTLSAGIQPGIISDKFKGSKVFIPDDDDYHEETDEAIPRTDISGTAFDLGAGLWYTRRSFAAGISMTHINGPKVSLSDGNASGTSGEDGTVKRYEFGPARTLYFMARGNIAIKSTLFEVIPSLLVMSDFTFTRAIATARVRWRKLITVGVGYRHDDALSAILGVDYKGFFLGYSYDYPTGDISKASSGSHEIVAGYRVKLDLGEKNRHKQKSIRIM